MRSRTSRAIGFASYARTIRRRLRTSLNSTPARIRRVIRRRVVVHGLVQGVFFRDSIRRLAQQHGVAGWVANRWDGTVEAVFEGDEAGVERLIEFTRHGPRGAQVERLEIVEEAPEG